MKLKYIVLQYTLTRTRLLMKLRRFNDAASYSCCCRELAAAGVMRCRPAYTYMLISPTSNSFYPRDAMLVRVIAIATCPSVRHTPVLCVCVKTKKASVMISSASGSPTILVS